MGRVWGFLLFFFFISCCFISWDIIKVKIWYISWLFLELGRVWAFYAKFITIRWIEAVRFILHLLWLWILITFFCALIFFSNFLHDFVEPVSLYCLYTFLLINLIHRDAFVLQSEEEEHHLVYFLSEPFLLFCFLLKFEPKFFFLDHEIDLTVIRYLKWSLFSLYSSFFQRRRWIAQVLWNFVCLQHQFRICRYFTWIICERVSLAR